MINEEVVDLLNEQINLELFSSYLYVEMANYFIDKGLDGFGNWLNMQALEEMDHAKIIMNYLQENGEKVIFKSIDDPSRDYNSNSEALEEVLSHEKEITASINNIYGKAIEEKDYRSKNFLEWFIEEQAEEEASANELISKYELFGKDGKGLYNLDRELGQRVHISPSILEE